MASSIPVGAIVEVLARQNSNAPTRKIRAVGTYGGIAAVVTALVATWLVERTGISAVCGEEISVLLVTLGSTGVTWLTATLAGYFKRDAAVAVVESN